jgi:proline racemase
MSLASSKNASNCSLVTVGNPFKKDGLAGLRYSIKVSTGTRVPGNTGVPPRISGEAVMERAAVETHGM